MSYDEPPQRRYVFTDMAKVRCGEEHHSLGLNLGATRLPFAEGFAVHDGRAVAIRFVVGRQHYNRDEGNLLVLDFSPDLDITRAFHAAHDRHPIRVFRNEGSQLFYRGLYVLVTVDHRARKWHFRRLAEGMQHTHRPVEQWIQEWRGRLARETQPAARPAKRARF